MVLVCKNNYRKKDVKSIDNETYELRYNLRSYKYNRDGRPKKQRGKYLSTTRINKEK